MAKVLICAFAFAPGYGSEPGIAYQLVKRLVARHQVWVLTDIRNRPFIQPEVVRGFLSTVRFVFVEPRVACPANCGSTLGHYLYYMAWQVAALRVARRLHQQLRFDIVHHLTYVNAWVPSLFAFVGAPFVWSAGNLERTPWAFLWRMSWRGRIEEGLRNLAVQVGYPLARWITGRRAALICSVSSPAHWGRKYRVRHFLLGGLSKEDLDALPEASLSEGPFRVLSVGRMVAGKGFDLGLQAFARLHRDFPDSEYWLIGDGPERPRLEALARRLDVWDAVQFLGLRPREEVFKCLAQAKVLLHPSLHETFGYAILEAMGAGVPVVCLDVGGPRVLVNDDVGVRVAVHDPEQVIRDLHKALAGLARDRSALAERGRRAREWARGTWSWDRRAEAVLELYTEALGKTYP